MPNLKAILLSMFTVVSLICLAMAFSNPSLAHYRQTILMAVAEQEANHEAQVERDAIAKEATALKSYFSAVHYDGSQLDAVTIQRRFPKLGRSIVVQHTPVSMSLNERLNHIKEQALQRVTVTHETVLYSLKADLAGHSRRESYGLWSYFSTCHNNRLLTYLGVAGQFHEEESGTCVSSR
jgi:hypothetical protein